MVSTLADVWDSVADFSAQAVINTILSNAFPSDPIIGEESSSDLRDDKDGNTNTKLLRERLTTLANETLSADLGYGEMEQWGIGPSHRERTTEELLDVIDKGNHPGGRNGRESPSSLLSPCSRARFRI